MPLSRLLRRLALFGSLSVTAACSAQVAPAATGSTAHLYVGAEYSRFQSDFHVYTPPGYLAPPTNGNVQLPGIGIYANLGLRGRLSAEAEVRLLNVTQPDGETEKTAMLGPSFRLYRRRGLSLSAKFVGGIGFIHFPFQEGYGSYFAFAPAGNVEYRLGGRFKARAEYEYVFQPQAPGLPNEPSNGVNPHGFSLGLSYRIF